MKQEIKQEKSIWIFLCYAFAIPLICIIAMQNQLFTDNRIIVFILYGIEGASPAIAAILVAAHKGGIAGALHFLRNKYVKAFKIKYILIGFIMPAFLLTLTKLITYLTPYNNQFLTIPSEKKIVIIFWALIAEELGWRGYLQDSIEERIGRKFTPLMVGGIWAAWHYHFFVSGSMEVPIFAFIYGCIVESYGYYLITKAAKGNIVPASVWHFSGNLFFNLYLLNPNWNGGSTVPYNISNLIMTVYIIAFIWKKKNTNLKGV